MHTCHLAYKDLSFTGTVQSRTHFMEDKQFELTVAFALHTIINVLIFATANAQNAHLLLLFNTQCAKINKYKIYIDIGIINLCRLFVVVGWCDDALVNSIVL